MDGGILVTGGTGHLGYHLIARLNALSVTPRVLVRREISPEAWGPLRVEPVRGDLDTGDGAAPAPELVRALEGARQVYHLAGCTSLRQSDRTRLDRVNRVGTIRLLEAARRCGVSRLVFTSTAATIGPSRDGTPLDENAQVHARGLRMPFVESKRSAESWLLERSGTLGHPQIVVANPSLLVGPPCAVRLGGGPCWDASGVSRSPGGPGSPEGRIATARTGGLGWLHFYVDGRINLVDVRDVAAALVRLMERGRAGERYLLTGPTVSISEILEAVTETFRVDGPRIRLPRRLVSWAARLAAFLEGDARAAENGHAGAGSTGTSTFGAGFAGGPAATLAELLQLLEHRWLFSAEKARREIGFAPIPLRQSLREQFGCVR